MIHGMALGWLHQIVGWLLYPVIFMLALALIMTLWELGIALAERTVTLRRLSANALQPFEHYAQKRLERVDLLARSGPILGLMGTLIPLGPGLTALGSGDISLLSTALTVAFDTTVIGLLIGLVAYIVSRVRRRWYERVWQSLVVADEA